MPAPSVSRQNPPVREGVDADGAVTASTARIPFSAFASEAARDAFKRRIENAPAGADIATLRRHYGRFNDVLAKEMLGKYPVDVGEEIIGGVAVHRVTPRDMALERADKILINLHGGGFMWGAGSGALVEAVPIAAIAGTSVITVDYRMAPEHVFPAASEDVCTVYEALLRTHAASNIGIYGCSAGAILTAQSIAWIREHGLPRPGAAAMLCGAGSEFSGDSAHLAPMLMGQQSDAATPSIFDMPYMRAARRDDPLALPDCSDELLSAFPPSLLITATRDFAASSVTQFHRRLVANGADAQLCVFDGLWHAFHIFSDLPESEETYRIIANFFARALTART